MKRCTLFLAALVALVMVNVAMAQNSTYGFISNSQNPHNFTNSGFSAGEICRPCHIPHTGGEWEAYSEMLWSHKVNPNASYNTRGGAMTAGNFLDTKSLLCMGCHDGTVALGDYTRGPQGGGNPGNGATLGTDMTHQHPVGKDGVYPTRSSYKPTSSASVHGQTVTVVGTTDATKDKAQLTLYKVNVTDSNNVTTAKDAVACLTCHNPHGTNLNRDGTTNQAPYPHLLTMSNQGSQLCLTCHNK
jgi:hypothetical protein